MNIRTATNEQLRDWLAIKQGWSPIYDLDGKASQWNRPLGSAYEVCFDHPTPNTIDAAAMRLPGGWIIRLDFECWSATQRGTAKRVFVDRTADEATDRFRLAVLAIEAMEEGK